MTHSISARNRLADSDLATAATTCRAMAYLNRAVQRLVFRLDVTEQPAGAQEGWLCDQPKRRQ
jgi:hypothetical protein